MSTFDRLRPIASRPLKIPKIQYEFGPIFDLTRTSPRRIRVFVKGKLLKRYVNGASLANSYCSRTLQCNQRDRHWIAESADLQSVGFVNDIDGIQ